MTTVFSKNSSSIWYLERYNVLHQNEEENRKGGNIKKHERLNDVFKYNDDADGLNEASK